MMWFDKNNENTVYFDIKREVKPTIVGDFRVLCFRDEVFDLVIFDPPHTQPGMTGIFYRKFGALRSSLIIPTLYKASRELFRVLKKGHFLFSSGTLTRKICIEFWPPFLIDHYLDNAQLEKSVTSQQAKLTGLLSKNQQLKSDNVALWRVSAMTSVANPASTHFDIALSTRDTQRNHTSEVKMNGS